MIIKTVIFNKQESTLISTQCFLKFTNPHLQILFIKRMIKKKKNSDKNLRNSLTCMNSSNQTAVQSLLN